MTNSTHLYSQLFDFLRQSSRAGDLPHLKALAGRVTALICSGQLSLSGWEPDVPSRATKAQSVERRWQRFWVNIRISVTALSVPLVLMALKGWQRHRLDRALDPPLLWECAKPTLRQRYCRIPLSLVCCGRAVPLLWPVLEHGSATGAFGQYQGLLRKARGLLRHPPEVMLLAERGFANPQLIRWLGSSRWHDGVRLPCDVLVQGLRRHPTEVGLMDPPLGEARL